MVGVLVLTTLAGCDAPQTPSLDAARSAAIESEVEAFFAHYREAFNARDADAILGLYVTDERFALYEDGTLRYASPQSIVDALASLPPGMSMSTEGEVTAVTPWTHDLASASTTYRSEMTMPEGGSFSIEGVMTALLEQSEGGWRIVQAHASSVRQRGGSAED